MDYQLLTFLILLILTVALVSLIIYVILLVKAINVTVKKANDLLDHAKGVTSFFANPLSSVAGIVTGIASAIKELRKE